MVKKNFLEEMNLVEAEEAFKKTTVAILPIGCLHTHGPAPIGIDNISINEILKKLSGKTNAILCPTIPYGPCGGNMSFPGTIHIDSEVFKSMLLDICRSLHKWGIKKVFFLNGHGGNIDSVKQVGFKIRKELGMIGIIANWWREIRELNPNYDRDATFIEPCVSLAVDLNLLDPLKDRIRTLKEETFLTEKFTPTGPNAAKFGNAIITFIGLVESDLTMKIGTKVLGSEVTADTGMKILDIITDYYIMLIKELEKMNIPPI
ncbi:creatininase family protein [Thermoproteota archaeon]